MSLVISLTLSSQTSAVDFYLARIVTMLRPAQFNKHSRAKMLIPATIITWILYTLFYHLHEPINWYRDTLTATPMSTLTSPKEASAPTSASTPTTASPTPMIPRKIWYKLGPKGLTDETRERIETCRSQNPTYESEILTDGSDDTYVRERFIDRPDIVQTYLDIPIPILKADLLRYLILFADGGIWSDLDVTCEGVPIDDWVPEQYMEHAGLVVGWEFDVGWTYFQRQVASWTIMAKPGSLHMAMVIDDILKGLRQKTEQYNTTISNLTYKMIEENEGIVAFSGPLRLTKSIIKSVELVLEI